MNQQLFKNNFCNQNSPYENYGQFPLQMDILLDKLTQYGIVDDAHPWFKKYLSDRQQSVKYSGSFSWSPVRIGVPQGSILGPLLFSIFVNDLPAVVNDAQIKMYADDTSYIVVVKCSG